MLDSNSNPEPDSELMPLPDLGPKLFQTRAAPDPKEKFRIRNPAINLKSQTHTPNWEVKFY